MRALARLTAPSPPLPVAVNPPVKEHALIDLQAVRVQGGAGVVAQLRPVAVELAADVGAEQTDCAVAAATDGGEPFAQEHALADLQAVRGQGRAGVVAQLRPGAVEIAADMGAEQANRAMVAATGSGEPFAQEHALANLQALGGQGRAGVVAQLRPGTVEVAADVGAVQVDRAGARVSDYSCPGQGRARCR